MHSRCSNPKYQKYASYGKRGIRVCPRWTGAEGFLHYLEDMGPPPTDDHSIDRIDNDKGYWCGRKECPECGPANREPNCRWATRSTQARNRRDSRFVSYKGRRSHLKTLCEELGVPYKEMHRRIVGRGWDVDRALSTPVRKCPPPGQGQSRRAIKRRKSS